MTTRVPSRPRAGGLVGLLCAATPFLVPGAAPAGLLTGAPAAAIGVPDSAGRPALTCNDRSDCSGLGASRVAPASLRADLRRLGLRLRYLGCGGVYLERCVDGDCRALLLAPFFSQVSLLRLGFGGIRSDPDAVAAGMDAVLVPEERRRVDTVLAGHSHHDHILDLPLLLERYLPRATAYGNQTLRNLLQSQIDPARLVSLRGRTVAATGADGAWTYVGNDTFRFVALASHHAPNVLPLGLPWLALNFATGTVPFPRRDLPARPRGWKVGQALAFVIDVLDVDGAVAYRIYYQDTPYAGDAAHAPARLVELGLDATARTADLALLCAATSNFEPGYFAGVQLRQQPRHVVLIHWEDFFRGYTVAVDRLRQVSVSPTGQVVADLLDQVTGASWVLPVPGSQLP